MDSKQPWFGYYFTLDQIYEYLSSLPEGRYNKTKNHEIFITWVLAKYLEFQKKSEHFIGFPSYENGKDLKLSDFIEKHLAIDDDNFDTVIVNSEDVRTPFRIQVKRYVNSKDVSTDHFLEYICEKVNMYGNAPEVNVTIHIQQKMKLDFPRLSELLKSRSFDIGSIIIFAEVPTDHKCFIVELYPNYTGQLWSPII